MLDAVYVMMRFMGTAAHLVRSTRERHGLTQRQLAIRAGTHQAAISRIESGDESPTFDRVEQLIVAMGEQVVVGAEPLRHDCDPVHLAAERRLKPAQRLERAFAWSRFNRSLQGAARR